MKEEEDLGRLAATKLINEMGGKVDTVKILPDGSGFAVGSFPLPEDHWTKRLVPDEPPAILAHIGKLAQAQVGLAVHAAVKWAYVRAGINADATEHDPDAFLRLVDEGLFGR